jgi:CRISPR-associated protein Csm5
MKQIYECYIKTVSPLHVGCDEAYEPMGFVVDETQNKLTAFDPVTLISMMDEKDKKRFSEICSKGTVESILEIYKFLRRRQANGRTVALCSGFVSHYNRTLSMSVNNRAMIQKELNNFAISRTSFLSADNRPYIPGSAVKGSLRTAFLNLVGQRQQLSTPKGKNAAKELEKNLLSYNELATDPFRLVKVSDFMPVGSVETRIVYAVDIKKSSGLSAKGPFQILETIEPGAIFCGKIVVEKPLSAGAIKKPISLEALLDSGKNFYSKEHRREQEELKVAGAFTHDGMFSQQSMPIRIGRHSGAESVTIEGHRDIKIMGGKGKKDRWDDHATTIWLSSEKSRPDNVANCRPFGWAEVCELSPLLAQEFENKEKEWAASTSDRKVAVFIQPHRGIPEKSPSIPAQEVEKAPAPEVWEKAILLYAPNTQIVSAKWEGKNASSKDLSLVPEHMIAALKKKKKTVTAKVTAELIGGKEYRLVHISSGD